MISNISSSGTFLKLSDSDWVKFNFGQNSLEKVLFELFLKDWNLAKVWLRTRTGFTQSFPDVGFIGIQQHFQNINETWISNRQQRWGRFWWKIISDCRVQIGEFLLPKRNLIINKQLPDSPHNDNKSERCELNGSFVDDVCPPHPVVSLMIRTAGVKETVRERGKWTQHHKIWDDGRKFIERLLTEINQEFCLILWCVIAANFSKSTNIRDLNCLHNEARLNTLWWNTFCSC